MNPFSSRPPLDLTPAPTQPSRWQRSSKWKTIYHWETARAVTPPGFQNRHERRKWAAIGRKLDRDTRKVPGSTTPLEPALHTSWRLFSWLNYDSPTGRRTSRPGRPPYKGDN